MRLLRPLLLTLTASVGTAATVAVLTGGHGSWSSTSQTDALLTALLDGDHSATHLPEQPAKQAREGDSDQAIAVSPDDQSSDPLLRVA